MAATFKTPKGTELPLADLKGKAYLLVPHRVQWFREDHPDWSIETEVREPEKGTCLAKATIKDSSGRVIATAHKTETVQGFQDFIEKSETGAVGRALALVGYGTQFAVELLEEHRIVDSPIPPKAQVRPVVRPPVSYADQAKRAPKWNPPPLDSEEDVP